MLAPIVVLGLMGTWQDARTYRSDALGLYFEYPSTWKLKKDKYSDNLEIAMADGSIATVQVFRTNFRQEAKVWQDLQREVAVQMARTVVRQWEETILGVPLLMTRLDFNEGGVERRTLVGLLYTATREKLNIRLTANNGVADEAERQWRSTMLTLRTTSGELPVREDPAKPIVDPTRTPEGKRVTILRAESETSKAVRSKNTTDLDVLGQRVRVHMPDGWDVEKKNDGFALVNGRLKGDVWLAFAPGGRAQVASALGDAAGGSFNRFSVVSLRDETPVKRQKSGMYVGATLRVGSNAEKAPLVVWHIAGTNDTLMFKVDYTATSESNWKSDRRLIERLIDLLSIEMSS